MEAITALKGGKKEGDKGLPFVGTFLASHFVDLLTALWKSSGFGFDPITKEFSKSSTLPLWEGGCVSYASSLDAHFLTASHVNETLGSGKCLGAFGLPRNNTSFLQLCTYMQDKSFSSYLQYHRTTISNRNLCFDTFCRTLTTPRHIENGLCMLARLLRGVSEFDIFYSDKCCVWTTQVVSNGGVLTHALLRKPIVDCVVPDEDPYLPFYFNRSALLHGKSRSPTDAENPLERPLARELTVIQGLGRTLAHTKPRNRSLAAARAQKTVHDYASKYAGAVLLPADVPKVPGGASHGDDSGGESEEEEEAGL